MSTTPQEIRDEIVLPVGGIQKFRFWMLLIGGLYVGIGLLYSGYKGFFFGEDEGFLYMLIYILQGALIGGVGLALKNGEIKLNQTGISIRSAKAKFEIEWDKLEQVKIEGDQIKFWDDKGLKVFPTRKLSEQDKMTLHNYLESFEIGKIPDSAGLAGFGETQF